MPSRETEKKVLHFPEKQERSFWDRLQWRSPWICLAVAFSVLAALSCFLSLHTALQAGLFFLAVLCEFLVFAMGMAFIIVVRSRPIILYVILVVIGGLLFFVVDGVVPFYLMFDKNYIWEAASLVFVLTSFFFLMLVYDVR